MNGNPPSSVTGSPDPRAGRSDHELERVLHVVPNAVWRCDAPTPIPLGTGPERMLEILHAEGRVGYANAAFARLRGHERAADLVGLPRSAVASAPTSQDVQQFTRFADAGFQPVESVQRISEGGRVRFFQVTSIATVDGDRLVSVWTLLSDITAERELSQRVTAAAGAGAESQVVGESPAIGRVLEKIEQVAPTDSTVLLRGETGTGKEILAQQIHRRSPRRDRPLIAVNCGAIAPGLVESELFGHEKGAFTGAQSRKLGRFELADGGTLFLDEIGDLAPELQVRLLRVLQEGEIVRVGGNAPIKVSVRVIAATHRDLPAMVKEGRFRQDLYYRLNVFPVAVPPLRERVEDIPLLAMHFTRMYAARLGKKIESIPPAVLDRLRDYPWPGNVRELANVIERSVIVSQSSTLQLAEWVTGQYQPVESGPAAPGPRGLLEVEREHIYRTLERTYWKVSGPGGAAEALGLKPTTLEARMKKLGITRPS